MQRKDIIRGNIANTNFKIEDTGVEEMTSEFNKIKKELIAEKSLLKQPNRQLTNKLIISRRL